MLHNFVSKVIKVFEIYSDSKSTIRRLVLYILLQAYVFQLFQSNRSIQNLTVCIFICEGNSCMYHQFKLCGGISIGSGVS